eukprot:m.111130 g.111130  ORF g.111130 m.111130 type:complete len:185 (+) comp16993_c0_seq1:389-943(+)
MSSQRSTCAFCLESLYMSRRTYGLPCTHVFHRNCLIAMVARSQVGTEHRCPVCRCDIPGDTLDDIVKPPETPEFRPYSSHGPALATLPLRHNPTRASRPTIARFDRESSPEPPRLCRAKRRRTLSGFPAVSVHDVESGATDIDDDRTTAAGTRVPIPLTLDCMVTVTRLFADALDAYRNEHAPQ